MRYSAARLILACLLAVLFGAPAASAQTLQDRFRLKPSVAHYVVLLDTSGSMKPYFTTVTGALRQFLASVRAPDTIAVLRFDTTWIRLCAGPAGQVDLSTCVPDRVEFGKYTDIGAALQQGIAELQRSAAEILVLLFLADGRHDPPPFSRYPGLVGPAWTDLERQGNELARRREVRGFAIGLQRYADVALLRRALPPDRTEVVSLAGPGLLQSRLDEIRMRIQRRMSIETDRLPDVQGQGHDGSAHADNLVREALCELQGVRETVPEARLRLGIRWSAT